MGANDMRGHGEHRRIDARSAWLRFWVWTVFVALCLAAGSVRLWQNHQRRAAQAAWRQRCARMDQLADDALRQVQTLMANAHGPDGRGHLPSQAEVERALNDGEPFELIRDGDRELAVWTAPGGGLTLELSFSNGKWTGYRKTMPTRQSLRPPPPVPMKFDQFTEQIRRQFAGSFSLGWGTGAWLVMLVLFVVWRQRRGLIAELMLGLTLLCGTAWLVSPYYSLTLQGIFSNDMLFWAVVMLVISLGCLTGSRRRATPPAEPLCPHCEYNLTGNVSGVCPECGQPVPASLRHRIGA